MPASYLSPKTEIRKSLIHGQGLFARRPIRKGEIVAIKGGHVFSRDELAKVKDRIAFAYIQIDDEFYLGAARRSEVKRNKIWLNHSCEPNVGIRGQSTFVAMRGVKPDEELTYDWAMEENDRSYTRCSCQRARCRRVLTGQDWQQPALQRRYRGYFSSYLVEKIARRRGRASSRTKS